MSFQKILTWTMVLAGCALHAQTITYSYDQAGRLTGATFPDGHVLTYTYDLSGNLLRRVVAASSSGPAPVASAAGVVNAASFLGGTVAPGELITIFGTGIGPAALANLQLTPYGLVDSFASGAAVLFDGVPAPVVYASAGQTAVIVPYSAQGRTTTQMVVQYQGRPSSAIALTVVAAAPGLFSADSSGKGNGAILNQDNSPNGPSNPAAPGSIVVLFGTGEGATDPRGVDGRLAATVFPKPLLPVSVAIGGATADVLYAGAAPGLVAGVFQINARVPQNIGSGAAPVVVTVGTVSSQPGLTVAVR